MLQPKKENNLTDSQDLNNHDHNEDNDLSDYKDETVGGLLQPHIFFL